MSPTQSITTTNRDRVLIIVPCLNEEDSIVRLLDELSMQAPDFDVVVVDDGSTDNTMKRVCPPAQCLRLPTNLGIGGAVQTGIQYAERRGYDYCVQVDGDGQHRPDQITKLLTAIKQTSSALVIGSRYLDETSEGFRSSFLRRFGGRVISRTLTLMYGHKVRITDPTSGFRAMDRRAISLFADAYPHDYPEPISIAWCFALDLPVYEISVLMRERQGGTSSIRLWKTLSYMVRVILYVMLSRITKLPEKLTYA